MDKEKQMISYLQKNNPILERFIVDLLSQMPKDLVKLQTNKNHKYFFQGRLFTALVLKLRKNAFRRPSTRPS